MLCRSFVSTFTPIRLRIMRTIFFLIFLNWANLSFCQQEFMNELGTNRAESFNKLMASYKSFLNTNFPETSGLGKQTRKFMMQMVNEKALSYDSLGAIDLIASLEQSGLRREICLYIGEIYDSANNIRQFVTNEVAEEIEQSIALINQEVSATDSIEMASSYLRYLEGLPSEQRKREEEMELKRQDRREWGCNPNPKGLYHYSLLKTDTSFTAYCRLRSMGISPAITPAITELTDNELESWNIQIIFMVDFYLENLLFRFRRHM